MPEDIRCPICGSETVIKTAKKGPNAGRKFYVCINHPECKGKAPIREEKDSDGFLVGQMENTSGQGKLADIPGEIRGWNWGAFLLNWIWGLSNRVWISLLCFIPFVSWIMIFVLGAKGNEWAWRNKKWGSVEHFKRTQRTWAWWGLGITIVLIVLNVIAIIVSAASDPYY